MPLALVISELVQNAVEHGLRDTGGTVSVRVDREQREASEGDVLQVAIVDDGTGIPAGFRPGKAGLGTQIVNTLVQGLHGTIRWEDAQPHGTQVRFFARLRPLEG